MPKKQKDPEFVIMTLNIKHTRDQVYGPAVDVKVPFEFAREFAYEEQCDKQVEERLHSTRAVLVLSRGRTKQVPVEAFDTGLADQFENPSNRVG